MARRAGVMVQWALACGFAWACTGLQAAVLFNQGGSGLPGVTSATAAGSGRAVFDDFTLTQDALLTRVEWTGGVLSAADPSGVASAPELKFFVALRSDDGSGAPAAAPLAQLTDFAVLPRVALSATDSQAVFRYGLDLPAAVGLSAGTRYWLQVTALFDGVPTDPTLAWDWSTSGSGNGVAAVFMPGPGANANGYAPLATDLSFSLIGSARNPVPEPPLLALMALAAALAAGAASRAQKRSSSRR